MHVPRRIRLAVAHDDHAVRKFARFQGDDIQVIEGEDGVLYVLPSGLELILLRRHVSAWSCVVIGDVAGCLFLFKLGFRKTALVLYVVVSAVEALILSSRLLTPESLVWITNLVPALLSASIVTWIFILWSMPQE